MRLVCACYMPCLLAWHGQDSRNNLGPLQDAAHLREAEEVYGGLRVASEGLVVGVLRASVWQSNW